MAQIPTTVSGYPSAGRVITSQGYGGATVAGATRIAQPATMVSGGLLGTQTRMAGATSVVGAPRVGAPMVIQSGSLQQARTITTPTGSLQQARTITTPTMVAGATTVLGASAGASRQARVISGGTAGIVQPVLGNTVVSPTMYTGSQPMVVSGAMAPRIVSGGIIAGAAGVARPATVISSSAVQGTTLIGQQASATQKAYEVKHKDDPQLQNLKELRKTSGLKNVGVNEALQHLKSISSDGKLSREQFVAGYTTLLQDSKEEVPSDDVKNAVFDLFDRDDNGVVDMMELICGASLLCTGSEEDKIHAVFNVFDENGDGVISMDEMFKFLTSVFKVVLTPNVMDVMNSMGVAVESAEDLASVTALECFKTADLNHDGRLSVEEFKNWFFAPRNDPSFLFSPVRKLLQ